jgi:hypothetical protein
MQPPHSNSSLFPQPVQPLQNYCLARKAWSALFPIIALPTDPHLAQAPRPNGEIVRRCKPLRFEKVGQFRTASTAVLRVKLIHRSKKRSARRI